MAEGSMGRNTEMTVQQPRVPPGVGWRRTRRLVLPPRASTEELRQRKGRNDRTTDVGEGRRECPIEVERLPAISQTQHFVAMAAESDISSDRSAQDNNQQTASGPNSNASAGTDISDNSTTASTYHSREYRSVISGSYYVVSCANAQSQGKIDGEDIKSGATETKSASSVWRVDADGRIKRFSVQPEPVDGTPCLATSASQNMQDNSLPNYAAPLKAAYPLGPLIPAEDPFLMMVTDSTRRRLTHIAASLMLPEKRSFVPLPLLRFAAMMVDMPTTANEATSVTLRGVEMMQILLDLMGGRRQGASLD